MRHTLGTQRPCAPFLLLALGGTLAVTVFTAVACAPTVSNEGDVDAAAWIPPSDDAGAPTAPAPRKDAGGDARPVVVAPDAAFSNDGQDGGADAAAASDAGNDASTIDAGTCIGSPDPCSVLLPGSCTTVMGCFDGVPPGCGGAPEPCSIQTDSLACDNLQGCFWDSTSSSCSGFPSSCGLFSTTTRCFAQSGCEWNYGSCAGSSTPCSSLTATTCYEQLGCLLE